MKFVTLTNHRSGSSHFQRLLDSHSDIRALGELLNNESSRNEKHLAEIYAPFEKWKAFGFKMMYTHADQNVMNFITGQGIGVINLIRKDVLETALWYGRHFTGEVKEGNGPRTVVLGEVEAKIESVLHTMKDIHRWIGEYRKYESFTVYYEDFTDPEGGQYFVNKQKRQELLGFLGVEDRGLYSELNVKNVKGPSEKIVRNWEELLKEMKRRGIERYYKE